MRKPIEVKISKTQEEQSDGGAHEALQSMLSWQKVKGGQVTLVGAGPGAADLLTIRAVRAMQSADIILFDDLVSDEVLELAHREAQRFTVGKRGGRSSCRQEDITALMIKFAMQGRHVVRLKSGDPMVFGRAGEEIAQLERLGLKVNVVPGITAAIAAASSTKTSLTHRDKAKGVKFVTGFSKDGQLPDLDWQACSDADTSLMVYMGAATAPLLAEKLLEHGLSGDTPVMIGRSISRHDEEISYTNVLALTKARITRGQPVLIAIGSVFAERMAAWQAEAREEGSAEEGTLISAVG